MRLNKSNQQLLLSLIILLLGAFFFPRDFEEEDLKEEQNFPAEALQEQTWQKTTVKRVIDGDTIELEGGYKLRYIGIDTPETVDPRKGVQCFGQEASLRNKELIEGKEIYLEKDVSETDRYGRLLRYVYLATNSASINEQLVSEGFAVSSSYPPDIKHQEKFKTKEEEARQAKRGLWSDEAACEI